jgi:hypothetical protein
MTFPKYLRPIHDVEAHGLTALEKAVRMIIFVPPLVLFSLPRGILMAFAPIAMGIFLFVPAGIDTIIHDPKAYSFEIMVFVTGCAVLLFSNSIAKAIRRNFLPFG